ncbi:DUF1840 domain-containing protein [Methylomarinum sp. Ch1-1]|uniref:DUF1840 domain-containing protein n=1 Tax=Methylomarinum roseum TaxID=3067653 RepID=A0AAU7NS56_9GAMM|nr:DUF1840 domain-containing protein [Methylomarinum sp. Ch1-1]MDP4520588.1 DUF1840 domain-containing protein [Methylomarinum sp. Ch1-1]
MLVTFSCSAYADITMFGDVAVHLLRLMGHSGTVPGAILADDVQEALERLVDALQKEQRLPEPDKSEEEEGEPVISLSHRALPLIELLEAAAKAKCNVMWDKNN